MTEKADEGDARTIRQPLWLRSLLWSCIVAILVTIMALHFWLYHQQQHVPDETLPRIDNTEDVSGSSVLLDSQNSANVPLIDSLQANSPYAYVFLLGACNPTRPTHRGFLFNILLATSQLKRSFQSKADIVVMVHISRWANTTRLSTQEEDWLEQVGASVVYLPSTLDNNYNNNNHNSNKDHHENFSSVQMLKFHLLRLTQYQRVLFLDSDVLPLCNLDYLFEMSVAGILRENVVIAWTKEPANGGFFLLQPAADAYDQLVDVVRRQRESAKNLPAPHFDKIHGWGHAMTPDDPWFTFQRRLSGRKWSFYAAYSDQGLLYHYVKFVRCSVSIVLGKSVQNWKPMTFENGTVAVALDKVLQEPFKNATCRRGNRSGERYMHHPATGNTLAILPPYGDFAHFYSVFKPWESLDEAIAAARLPSKRSAENVLQYWFYLLRELNERLHMHIPMPRQDGDDVDTAWREYSKVFRNNKHLGGNRVPTLKALASQNRSAILALS